MPVCVHPFKADGLVIKDFLVIRKKRTPSFLCSQANFVCIQALPIHPVCWTRKTGRDVTLVMSQGYF